MEVEKLTNERLRLENERTVGLFWQNDMDLVDVYHEGILGILC